METLRTAKRVLRSPRQGAGHGTGSAGQTPVCPGRPVTNGFLKRPVPPLYTCEANGLPRQQVAEKAIGRAFKEIAAKYGIDPGSLDRTAYPYNVLTAFDRLTHALQYERPEADFYIVSTEENGIALLERETVPNNNTLYYIPVAPLYRSLKVRPKCKGLQVLLSVFAYLYHVAEIPYYCDPSSYLNWQYEMIAEWMENDPDAFEEGYYQRRIADLKMAAYIGEQIARKIHNPCHLEWFERRVNGFVPQSHWDSEVQEIGRQALHLYQQYPNATLTSNVAESEDDYDNETIEIGQYVSFIHDFEGSLYDEIFQMVNDDFGNRGTLQEPTCEMVYGIAGNKEGSLDFERQLFALIDDLTTLLMAM